MKLFRPVFAECPRLSLADFSFLHPTLFQDLEFDFSPDQPEKNLLYSRNRFIDTDRTEVRNAYLVVPYLDVVQERRDDLVHVGLAPDVLCQVLIDSLPHHAPDALQARDPDLGRQLWVVGLIVAHLGEFLDEKVIPPAILYSHYFFFILF